MLGHLIRKEILDHFSGLKFPILSLIGALAIWISLYSGYAYYAESLQEYGLAQAATEDRIQQLMAADDWMEIIGGSYQIHKPPLPLSVFVRGLETTLGRSISVSSAGGPTRRLMLSPAEVEPDLGISPPRTWGWWYRWS